MLRVHLRASSVNTYLHEISMRQASFLFRNVGILSHLLSSRSGWSTLSPVARVATGHTGSIATRRLATVSPPALDEPKTLANRAVILRPYQEDCIQSVLDYLAKGEKRLGISLATGSGKTVIFSHLIDRIPAPSQAATQTLILAHRGELVEQAAAHCQRLYPDKTVEVEMGTLKASGVADITVASVQSIVSGERILRFDPDRFKLLLVDEAHHIVSSSYLDVLRHFKLLDKENRGNAALVGVSATLSRHDGLGLAAAIDHIVYHKDYVDMIDGEWLSSVVFTTVHTGADLSRVKSSRGDFQTGSLSKAVNSEETNTITVRSWLEKAKRRNSTLGFCCDLNHVAGLTAAFREHGIDARFITGDTDRKTRVERLNDFKAGKFPVLLNCGIFTEGTDIPNVDCVLLARPTKSRNLLVQMIGRGLRKHTAKENCHVIDMVSSLETGIVTTPTLFGLDPGTLVNENDARHMEDLRDRKEKEQRREQDVALSLDPGGKSFELRGQVTFTDYDDINDLIQDTSGERHIRSISFHGWVEVDESKFVLSSRIGDYLTIKREDEHFVIMHNRKLPADVGAKAPYAKPQKIARSSTFEGAVHAADTWASASPAFPFDFISKNAYWRRSEASQGQIDMLNKSRAEGEKLEVSSISKGRAADWITKIKHGAKGRFARLASEKKRAERASERSQQWQDMQKRSRVSVGPVV